MSSIEVKSEPGDALKIWSMSGMHFAIVFKEGVFEPARG